MSIISTRPGLVSLLRSYLLTLCLMPLLNPGFGQSAPSISYPTPQVLVRNVATTINPANSGGAVPSGTYRNVSILAGTTQGFQNNTGTVARFNRPAGMTIDGSGNLYIADTYNHRIRFVTPDGVVTTLAGDGNESFGWGRLQNGNGTAASFNYPTDIVIHPDGSCLYVADKENDVIRRIELTTPFAVTTFAGDGTGAGSAAGGFADNATATSAKFNQPEGLFFDNSGATHYLYVADRSNHRIRRIQLVGTTGAATAGAITTIAGSSTSGNTEGAAVGTAKFNNPVQVAVSANGSNIYVADLGNNKIRKIDLGTTTVSTLAGSGTAGGAEGTGASATFNAPYGIEFDGVGNLVVSDQTGHRIRRVTTAGVVTNLAGTGSANTTDGLGSSAAFNTPSGMVFNAGTSLLYVCDLNNSRIRKIEMSGYEVSPSLPTGLSLAAGTGVISGTPTALSAAANFTVTAYNFYGNGSSTISIAVADLPTLTTTAVSSITTTTASSGGNITADGGASVTARGVVWSTSPSPTVALSTKTADGTGTGSYTSSITGLSLNTTYYVRAYATTAAGTSYGTEMSFTTLQVAPSISYGASPTFTFTAGTAISAVTLNNTGGVPDKVQVSTLAGSGVLGFADGTGTAARFNGPSAIAADATGNLYVTDMGNHRIRKVVIATGEVTTLAGSSLGFSEGTGTSAKFFYPTGIVIGNSGELFVSDSYNHIIRKIIISTREVTTLAGSVGSMSYADGTGNLAAFNTPRGLATDGSNLYVADQRNNLIRKIVISSGVVTTLAGSIGWGLVNSTIGTSAKFYFPTGIANDGNGNLFVADNTNHIIRKIVISTGAVTTFAGDAVRRYADGSAGSASFNGPHGITSDGSGNLYVADEGNHCIRKITIGAGVVSTQAGSGLFSGASSDGAGTDARFKTPTGVTLDAGGNIYVADYGNHVIRVISNYRISPALPAGLSFDALTGTIAGTPTVAQAAKVYTVYAKNSGGAVSTQVTISVASAPTVVTGAASNVTATSAKLNGTVNMNGGTSTSLSIIYSTSQATIESGGGSAASVSPASVSGSTLFPISANITGLSASTTYYYRVMAANSVGTTYGETKIFTTAPPAPVLIYPSPQMYNYPAGMAITPLTITHSGGPVEPMIVRTLAGPRITDAGYADGIGTAAKFFYPNGIIADGNGNLFVADMANHRIRKIVIATGEVTTIAGSSVSGNEDGVGAAARFKSPTGITIDHAGNLYVADYGNNRIRKIALATMNVTTIAGSTLGDAEGNGLSAKFNNPRDIEFDGNEHLYVADLVNQKIRKININSGNVTTVAGTTKGFADGAALSAQFNDPIGMTMGSDGNLYIAENQGHRIRCLNLTTNMVSTLAGSGRAGKDNGIGMNATFNMPTGLCADGNGNLYVTDYNSHLIRKIVISTREVTTLAGWEGGYQDGVGVSAYFYSPRNITIDAQGTLYVTDRNSAVRRMDRYSISPATLPAGLQFNYGTGTISGTPTVQSPNTIYRINAANTGGHTSSDINIEISSSISTAEASSITETTATSGGNVDATEYAGATQKGVCWNTTGTPTTSDAKTEQGSGTGTFTSSMTGLLPNTTYYVRSYVIVGSTTTYGGQKTFKTNELGTFDNIIKTYGDAMFSITAPTAVSTGAFSFSSSNTSVASISTEGEVTIAGVGTTTITATQSAAGAYASVTKALTLTVNKGTPSITLSVPTATALNQVTGANTITVSGTSSDGQPVTMSIVSGGATGTLTATATPGEYTLSNVSSSGIITFEGGVAGTANMNAATKQTAMDVTKNNQTITFASLSPVTYANGLTQTLTATTNATGLTVSFDRVSGPGNIAGNTLTITGPGTIVIKASQAGDGMYNAAPDVERSLTVNPAVPVITSFTPTSATQGETVTITGQYFQNVTSVSFGGTAATSFNVVSATQITAVVGTGHTGVISVTTTGGTDTEPGFRYKVTWTGATNAFNTASNWSGSRIPQTDDDIIFSPTAASDLELDASKTVGNVDFNGSGRSLKLGAYNLTVKGNLTMPGNIAGSGKVIMGGSSAQTIRGGGDIPDLEINNSAGVTIDATGDELTVSGTLRSAAGTLTTNGKLRLTSNSSGTARVGVVGGTISGNVIAERYVQQNQNSGGTGRAWRLVSVPVTGTGTLRDFFMNGRAGQDLTLTASRDAETENSGTPIVGHNYATASAATTAGFDWIGVANQVSSLRYYTASAGGGSFASENVPTMTTDYANAAQGYMVFSRGDRKLEFPSTTSAGATTFRSTGSLKTGNQTVTIQPASTSKFTLVGNPYMSVLDLSALYTSNSSVIEPSFWIWDANMAGTNYQGGYVNVYLSGGQWVTNTGSYINPELIESGMAFFAEPKSTLSADATLTITESHKSSASSAGLSPFATDESDDHGRMYVRLERADDKGQRQLIDGVMADFHSSFKTTLGDPSDREKLRNGISRGALWLKTEQKLLSSEGLPWPKTDKRSIPLYMSGVGDQTLIVRIDPRGMRDRYVQAWLKDNVLKRQIEINMNAPADYDFIGTGSASWDSTRFEIVYVEAGRPSTGVTLEPDDAAEAPSVKLYPNPSKSADVKLSLRAMTPGTYSIQVLDMTGRLVATTGINHRSLNGEYRILEGRRLSPGKYLIRLSQSGTPVQTLQLIHE